MDRFADEGELASLLGDWTAGPGPLYQKLADALRGVIVAGKVRVTKGTECEASRAGAINGSADCPVTMIGGSACGFCACAPADVQAPAVASKTRSENRGACIVMRNSPYRPARFIRLLMMR